MAKKKGNQKNTPKVNPELEGFDIKIDSFGEIKTNFNIDKINEFLNRNVDDKKLRDRDDIFEENEDESKEYKEEPEDQLIEEQVEDELDKEHDPEDSLEDDDFDDFTLEEDDDDDFEDDNLK
ncbi:hypothetical protein BH23BAC1_BH23BAC1_40560 [soil metagenome]